MVMAEATNHYFKHLGVSDGLSQVCIPSIYQDELGAVWLGTTEGLNRYNGKDVKVFQPSESNHGLTNNEINELCGDKNGRMYIRSGNDLIKLDIYTEQFTCLRQKGVYGLFCKKDTLWVSCADGIYYYTGQGTELTFFARVQKGFVGRALYVDKETVWVVTRKYLVAISREDPLRQEILLTLDKGNCILGDSSGNIWVGAWNGLYRISPNRETTAYVSHSGMGELSDNQVRCVLEDDFKHIWVGTFKGIDCYDPITDTWSHYTRYGSSSNSLSHTSILSLHKDMQGNIWVGTYYGGVNVFNPDKNNHSFYCAEPLREDCLSFPVVGKMTEDSAGNVWICTEGGGLNCYHGDTGVFSRYMYQKGDQGTLGSNNVKSVFYRKENNRLYAGTHIGGLFVLDLKSNKGHTLHHVTGDPASLPHEIVNDIQEYKDGIAMLTQGGPVFFDPVTEKFSPLTDDPSVQKLISREYAFETFLIDSRQRMWLAVGGGGIVCVNLSSSKVTQYLADSEKDTLTVGRYKTVHIFEDNKGDIYFSTIGAGIFKYQEKQDTFKSYGTTNGVLPSNYCYYICESARDNCLLVLHGKGLSIFDREKEVTEETYHLFRQTYNLGSALYRSKNGIIYISGTNGLAMFQERSFYESQVKSFLNFDKLFIFNDEIAPGDESGILTEILAKTSDIFLSYQQNNVTVEFATFNYNSDRNRLFEYYLDGFDKVWTQTSGTTVTYTNLPPGDYTLKVRSMENKESLKDAICLNIHVSAPFYATIWAYLFYVLCLTALMVAFVRFKTRQAALRSSLEFERKEKERIEELNQVKLRFFTNISHEFRTPLTLILGQIEVLMQMDLGTTIYNRIQRIYKNAWHMRNLISELLDFRKQEQGYLKLRVEEQNLVTFTRQIYMCFYEYAQKKEITYRFDSVEETISVWFDPIQLQKVIFNLLSNAFKYTPNKGSIRVEVRMLASQAIVSVCDTGVGIPEEHISKIFERFYQTDNSSSFTLGTGIGLALAKGIMNMHHGKIDVESTVGKGTKFTLSLPLGNRHFSDEEMATVESRESVIISEAVPMLPFEQIMDVEEEKTKVQENIKEEDKPIILLVDDNEELLSMLEDLFLPIYKVYIAHDGREGLEMARQIQPDLIISDVMMPEMSGKELCYKIKTNVKLSHISVVLLTAQTSVEYVVEGLMFGADDYVTKPFNVKVLIARCNNLIKNKKRLIAHYAGKTITESPVTEAINERDKELLAKCVNIIKENFENPAFDVTALASELCVGRSKLYMQFKQMTGLTPNEFILKIKLDEAMSLLKNHPELNISEISIRLGFSSPRYFSKSFKAFFGVAPQTVRSRKKE